MVADTQGHLLARAGTHVAGARDIQLDLSPPTLTYRSAAADEVMERER